MATVMPLRAACPTVRGPSSSESAVSAAWRCRFAALPVGGSCAGLPPALHGVVRADTVALPRRGAGGALALRMNLFERAVRVIKSYANAIVTSAEDPEKMLEQTVAEMQEDLIKMRQASAQVMASQKQLEARYRQAEVTADDWYKRAQLALGKGDEELAREALKRRKTAQDNASGMRAQLEAQTAAVEKLLANTRLLESKLSEAKSKKDTLKARAQSAKASQKANEMVGGLSTTNALAAFERMEEKVLAMEAEADATALLTGGDAVSSQFAALEGGDSVDEELAALKKGLLGPGSSKPAGALPAGRSLDAIDAELADLKKDMR